MGISGEFRFDRLPPSPFYNMIPAITEPEDAPAGLAPIDLTLGDPRHSIPDFVGDILMREVAGFGRYQPTGGPPSLRAAIAEYLTRRYELPDGFVDPERHVLATSGSREALFMLPVGTLDSPNGASGADRPAILYPAPGYPSYAAGALAAGFEPVAIPATAENGFLPDFLAAEFAAELDRAAAIYLCSPANPQGSVVGREALVRLIEEVRARDILLIVDECYADLYDREPPVGALQACAALGAGPRGTMMDNVVVSHSLSKRSNLPGMRSGFVAGDQAVLARFLKTRHTAAVAMPRPIAAVSEECWRDGAHVRANRDRYRAKIDMAEAILGHRFGFYRPPGGFFLWLSVEDDEASARQIWRKAAVKTIPGSYLAGEAAGGANPGAGFLRVALVPEETELEEALRRMAELSL